MNPPMTAEQAELALGRGREAFAQGKYEAAIVFSINISSATISHPKGMDAAEWLSNNRSRYRTAAGIASVRVENPRSTRLPAGLEGRRPASLDAIPTTARVLRDRSASFAAATWGKDASRWIEQW